MRTRFSTVLFLAVLSCPALSLRQDPPEQEAATVQIPAPDVAAAWVPDGYRVEIAASGLMYPSSIAFDDQGKIYVAECGYFPGDTTKPARILELSTSLDGGSTVVVSAGLVGPITDLLWHDGHLFVSHKGKISVLEGGGVRDLVTDLPSQGDHSNNQLAVGPDGKLYVGQGSATNSGVVGEDNWAFGWVESNPEVCDRPAKDITLRGQQFESLDPRMKGKRVSATTSAFQSFGIAANDGTVVKGTTKANGTILRMKTDGSGLEVHAWGFRNPYGVAFGPDGKLYVADAGSDVRGSRPIADSPEMLWIVEEGAWYGWPDFFAGIPVTDPRFRPEKGPAPQFVMKDHPPVGKPAATFELHSSVTQIDFSTSAAFGFEGQMFLGSSGDQSAVTAEEDVRSGYWVKRIDPTTMKAEMFFRTRPEALGPDPLEYVTTPGPKRIVDLCFTPDGTSLYVVDIGPIHYTKGVQGPTPVAFPGTGVVWRITRTGK